MTKMRKKMLISSMAMLLIATLALSSASFAWFTAGDTAKIETMKFTTEASSGIQISADAVNWKSTLVAGTTGTNDLTVEGKLDPCSSVGTVTNGVMALFKGEVSNTTLVTTTAQLAKNETSSGTNDGTNGYWKFDIYVNNAGATEQTLYLDAAATTVKNATDGETTKNIENAVRIAFIDQGQGTAETQSADSVKAAVGGSKAVIWEPNATAHDTNVTTYRYSVSSDGKINTEKKIASNTAETYYVGISSADAENITYDGYAGNVYAGSSKVLVCGGIEDNEAGKIDDDTKVDVINVSEGKIKIANLAANKITKLTIYVWIEGQDVDCNNSESGGSVNIKFGFSTSNT